MNIVVTGANGFIGKNLIAWLTRTTDHHILPIERSTAVSAIESTLAKADLVFHLAGINRPQTEAEFYTGNVEFTAQLCRHLLATKRACPLILASSSQAALANPYGISKRQAEETVQQYAEESGARVSIYRLKNVFGKWCRPNYNSVVATFCHNIAHALPITISDPNRELELVYIDDVAMHFQEEIRSTAPSHSVSYREVLPIHRITLGALAELIQSFRQMRETLVMPAFNDDFVRKLYATYLSYLAPDRFAYALEQKCDPRGCLAEFIKSPSFGQIFVSRTVPGITRGNHYHHTKTEKFLVLAGEALIRFRHLSNNEIIEIPVRGEEFRVVDIPPGYTHSIENVGEQALITLFWASEIFDPARPDTYALTVLP